MTKNYIVIHYLNDKAIGRWDFGQDFAQAKNHMLFLKESVYQKGNHHIMVMEEHNPLQDKYDYCSFTL